MNGVVSGRTHKPEGPETIWAKYRCVKCRQMHWHETADHVDKEAVYERVCDYCQLEIARLEKTLAERATEGNSRQPHTR
jgi:hypothetical protein